MTDDRKPEAISDNDLDAASGGHGRVSLNYEKIEWTYKRQTAAYGKDGSKGGNVETTWKIEEGET